MTTYRLNPVAFREQVLNADWMEALMRERAELGAEFARSIAPVDESSHHPGLYKGSIQATSGKHGGIHGDRAYGEVSADARTPDGANLAVIVEFGTEHQDGHHVMARTLDAM